MWAFFYAFFYSCSLNQACFPENVISVPKDEDILGMLVFFDLIYIQSGSTLSIQIG